MLLIGRLRMSEGSERYYSILGQEILTSVSAQLEAGQ